MFIINIILTLTISYITKSDIPCKTQEHLHRLVWCLLTTKIVSLFYPWQFVSFGDTCIPFAGTYFFTKFTTSKYSLKSGRRRNSNPQLKQWLILFCYRIWGKSNWIISDFYYRFYLTFFEKKGIKGHNW